VLKPEYFELPSDGVVLFHAARSYCAQQVRLALEEKGVAWVSRPLSLRQAEHFAPAYARMNPHMVVPTLADRGRVVRDAARIIRFVDLRFDGPQLCPDDPDALDRMEHWIGIADRLPVKYLSAANLPEDLRGWQIKGWLYRLEVLLQLMDEHADDPDLTALYQRKHAEIEEWCRVEADKAHADAVMREVEQVLDRLQDALDDDCLAGPDYSLADLAWTPVFYRIIECGLDRFWSEGRRPRLAAYVARLMARPSTDAAITAFLDGRRQ